MITIEDKIKTFSKFVYERQVQDCKRQIDQIEKENNDILYSRKIELEEQSKQFNKKMNTKIKLETQKIISSAKLQAKEKLLNTKKKLLEQFYQEIIDGLIEFVKKPEYDRYIWSIVKKYNECLNDDQVKLYLIKDDFIKYKDDLISKYPSLEIFPMSDYNIGGIIIELPSSNERINLTIREKAENAKTEIGIKLYEALEE